MITTYQFINVLYNVNLTVIYAKQSGCNNKNTSAIYSIELQLGNKKILDLRKNVRRQEKAVTQYARYEL